MTRYLLCRCGCGRMTTKVKNLSGGLRVTYGGFIKGHEANAPAPLLLKDDYLVRRRLVDFKIAAAEAAGVVKQRFGNIGGPRSIEDAPGFPSRTFVR